MKRGWTLSRFWKYKQFCLYRSPNVYENQLPAIALSTPRALNWRVWEGYERTCSDQSAEFNVASRGHSMWRYRTEACASSHHYRTEISLAVVQILKFKDPGNKVLQYWIFSLLCPWLFDLGFYTFRSIWIVCFSFMQMSVLLNVYVCAPLSTWYLLRLEEGIRSPGTGVRNSCGPHVGAKDSNPHLLQKQSVVMVTEPSLGAIFLC